MSFAQRQEFIVDVQPLTMFSLTEVYRIPEPQAKCWNNEHVTALVIPFPENTVDFIAHNLPKLLEEMVAADFLEDWIGSKIALLRKLLTSSALYRKIIMPHHLASLTEDPATVAGFSTFQRRDTKITEETLFSHAETFVVTVDDAAELDVCPVSLEPFLVGSTAVRLDCSHVFDPNELKRWICVCNNNTCPVCKAPIVRGHLPAVFRAFLIRPKARESPEDMAFIIEGIENQTLVRNKEVEFALTLCGCFVTSMCTMVDEWSMKISGHQDHSKYFTLVNFEKLTNGLKTRCELCKKVPLKGGISKLLACARCLLTAYCSKECQVSHWKEHKKHCFKNAARKTSSEPVAKSATVFAAGGDAAQVQEGANLADVPGVEALSFSPQWGAFFFQTGSPIYHTVVSDSPDALLDEIEKLLKDCQIKNIKLDANRQFIGLPVVPYSKVAEYRKCKPSTSFAVVSATDFTIYEYGNSEPLLSGKMPVHSAFPPEYRGRMSVFDYALLLAEHTVKSLERFF